MDRAVTGTRGRWWLRAAAAGLALATVVASSCGQNRLDQGTSGQPITVGLVTALSPPGDVPSGQLIQRGAKLGIEYVNQQLHGVLGNRSLRLATEDSSGQPDKGVTGFRQLATQEHAVAVTGFTHSSVATAVNEVAKDTGVATIATNASGDSVTDKHYPTTFRTAIVSEVITSSWLDWIAQRHLQKVAVVAENSDYGLSLVGRFQALAQTKTPGLAIDVETFDHATTNLTPQLLKVKGFNANLVINIGAGPTVDLMIDQATQVSLYPQADMLIAYDAPTQPQWWELHPQNGSGVYFSTQYSPKQSLSKQGQWMRQQYEKQYRESPLYAAFSAFGDVLLIAQAINQAKSAEPRKIAEALASGRFTGWTSDQVTFPNLAGPLFHTWAPPSMVLHYTTPRQNWMNAQIVSTYNAPRGGGG